MPESSKPAVSIILPTYNRASFLPEACAAIAGQQWTDWELIVVDDGSTDNTSELISELTCAWQQQIRYIRQENQGAYGARNTGLDNATGKYVAFYDSDDLWLPHHLSGCVEALESNLDVDWVFSACRRVDHATGRELLANSFYYEDGRPWPFLQLTARKKGRLRILDDQRTLPCMLGAGLNCGLQASLIRRETLADYRFQTHFRNEAEDQMAVIWALASGKKLAYFDAPHVVYRVHSANSSATESQAVDKRLAVMLAEARGYEEIPERGIRLSAQAERARRRRLLEQYFWQIGYALQWQSGRRNDAFKMYRRGLSYWRWDWRCWKTYIIATLRMLGGLTYYSA